MNAYILDKNLQLIGIIDSYKSFIWAKRYNKVGDCELYLPVTTENLNLLQKGNYIYYPDDDMVCRIDRIEIDTDIENGNYLIVNASDAKSLLDQRIVWNVANCDGNLEDFIRALVTDAVCASGSRQMQKENGEQLIYLDDKANFTEMLTEQVSFTNLGAKIREYAQKYGWGYKVSFGGDRLLFSLYAGKDVSNNVIFSDQFENLASTKYVKDNTNLGNAARIGGTGEGSDRKFADYGAAQSVDRYEVFVDAKSISNLSEYSELTALYPGGTITRNGSAYVYVVSTLNIQIVDDAQLARLQIAYPNGTVVTIDGNEFYAVSNIAIADLDTNSPSANTKVTLKDVIYEVYLLNKGAEEVAKYGEKTTFEGSIIPDMTFKYKTDYDLGDIVAIQNEYGIRQNVRIVEIVEVTDENGYKIEPKFEYIEN